MKFRLVAALAVSTVVVFGTATACSSPTPQQPQTQSVSLPVDAPRVTVVSPGTGEKRLLQFADAGAQQRVGVRITDGFDQATADAAQVDPAPPTTMHTEILTASLEAQVSQGTPREVSMTLREPHHSNATHAADATSIDGFAMTLAGAASGRPDTVTMSAPTSATDSGRALAELFLRKLLAQPVVFPAEPVGEGASWTVDNRVAGDSTMLRQSTYRVVSLRGNDVELAVDITERPAVTALSLGDQGELKTVSTKSHGSGNLKISLTQPLPTAGEFSLTTRVVYGQDGSPTRIVQDFSSGVKFQ